MAVTTQEQEYKRLRSYLNPFLGGPAVDAVLNALAAGSSSYLINNAAAVNDMLYIVSASGPYLDQRLADYGIVRPANVGLSDEIFREVGIQVKNRKQVRDLMNNLLNDIFGDLFVRASSKSAALEPYNLNDGDTLIVNFDDNHTVTITFTTGQFANIHAALAQEVADAITTSLLSLGYSGTAIAANDGNGNYVELLSNTIGPASSITVLGGRAQNQLLFAATVVAGGNASTQWTITLQNGGLIRFTWTGGANPNVGKVSPGDYVNIYGGGFASSPNEGTYTIVKAVGGVSGAAYFEVENPFGVSGIVVEGVDNAVLFYNPIRKTLASLQYYAAIYQTEARILQIFLPATTQVIRRSRLGSAHIHYPPTVAYKFNANPNINDVFSITTANSFVAGTDFVIGATPQETIANMIPVINAVTGLDAVAGAPLAFPDLTPGQGNLSTLTVYQDSPSLTLTGTYTGSASIVPTGLVGDPISVQPNQPGPYSYDLNQRFTVSDINTTLTQDLNGIVPRVFTVADATKFPNSQGFLIFGYGTAEQEGPVPYIGAPSNNTLLISPAYTIKTPHANGSTVTLVAQDSSVTISTDGTDYPFYLTDIVSGRIYAESLIQQVAATGISIVFTILYPSDEGLGKWGTPYSEISYVYGP
jgi:hypothetical protein